MNLLLPRTKTKRRVLKKIKIKIEEYKNEKISDFSLNQTVQSYFGYFKHASSYKIEQKLKDFLYLHV